MKTAKTMGYEVIDEFGIDISSRVYFQIVNWELQVIDEFGDNIIGRVKIAKAQ